MYREITLQDFQQDLHLMKSFTPDGIKAVFDILQLEEKELGYEYKFDPVWISCSFALYKESELLEEYGVDNIDQMADYQLWEVAPNLQRMETEKSYILRL